MTSTVVAASGYSEVNEFGYLSSQSVELVPDDEYQLVMLDDGAAAFLHSRTVQCSRTWLRMFYQKHTTNRQSSTRWLS
jgi:hypothetical protein